MTIAQDEVDVKSAYRSSPVHGYVRQMVIAETPRFQRVNDDCYLAIIEGEKVTPISVELHPQGVLVVVDYQRSQAFSLDALAEPDRILDYLGLADDRNQVFSRMCAAFLDAHRPPAGDNGDGDDGPDEPKATLLTLATDEIRNRAQWHSGEIVTIWQAGDTRAWIKNQNGWLVLVLFRDADELADRKYSKPLTVGYLDPQAMVWEVSPTVDEQYPAWAEQAKTQIGQVATVRKPNELQIARQAGATHQDTRPGHEDTFYRVTYPQVGQVLQMSVNGTAGEWQASRYNYAPDWAEAI